MRALLRTSACIAVLTPFALLVAGSAYAVTITGAVIQNSATSGAGTTANNVATAADDPYCSGTIFVISGTGFVGDSATPDPIKGAVTGVSIGNVPAAWFKVGSDITLYAQVGAGATTGPIVVTTNAGSFTTDSLPGGRISQTANSAQSLMAGVQIIPCVSKPTIVKAAVTGIKPNPAKGGKNVEIFGSGFSGVTAVTVGGKAATFAVVQDQNIVVTVPKTAPNGKLTVVITNSAGSTTSTVKLVKKA
jgi:IPT/TIG domain